MFLTSKSMCWICAAFLSILYLEYSWGLMWLQVWTLPPAQCAKAISTSTFNGWMVEMCGISLKIFTPNALSIQIYIFIYHFQPPTKKELMNLSNSERHSFDVLFAKICSPRFVRLAHGSLRCWAVKQHLRGTTSCSAPPHRLERLRGMGGGKTLGDHYLLEKFHKSKFQIWLQGFSAGIKKMSEKNLTLCDLRSCFFGEFLQHRTFFRGLRFDLVVMQALLGHSMKSGIGSVTEGSNGATSDQFTSSPWLVTVYRGVYSPALLGLFHYYRDP